MAARRSGWRWRVTMAVVCLAIAGCQQSPEAELAAAVTGLWDLPDDSGELIIDLRDAMVPRVAIITADGRTELPVVEWTTEPDRELVIIILQPTTSPVTEHAWLIRRVWDDKEDGDYHIVVASESGAFVHTLRDRDDLDDLDDW